MRLTLVCVATTWATVTTLASGSSLFTPSTRPAGDLLAAADDFDAVDDRVLARQSLYGVQMGEDAGIVDRARLRQHGDHGERFAQQLERVAFVEPSIAAASAPTRASWLARSSMTRFRTRVFLSLRLGFAPDVDRSATDRTREDARSRPGRFGLKFALGQDARSASIAASSSTGTHSFGDRLSTPCRFDIVSRRTYSSGIVSLCMSAE